MAFADELMQEFLNAYPEAATGKWSLEVLNEKLQVFMQNRNRKPLTAFEGLSAEQMHVLLDDPVAENSVLGCQGGLAENVLNSIPFFRLYERLLDLLEKAPIKLTQKGNLPLSVCSHLYAAKFLVQEDIEKGYTKKISEDNVEFLQALKSCALIGPHIKKRNNTLSLTQAGKKSLTKQRTHRYWELFEIYTQQYNWAFTDNAQTIVGQFGWAYSLFLLHKYGGQWQEPGFYASKFLVAFPHLQQKVPSPYFSDIGIDPERIYEWRFIESFAEWFGLIEIDNPKSKGPDQTSIIRKSALFDQLFSFTISKP